MSKRAKSHGQDICISCSVRLHPNSVYCHSCGRKQSGGGLFQSRLVRVGAFGVVLLAILAGLVVLPLGNTTQEPLGSDLARLPTDLLPPTPSTTPAAPAAPASTGNPGAVDLASMSPREAADRLFNRVMRASEGGNQSEAAQFAPMALQAYQMVPVLDADAQFHIGLIKLATGDVAGVREQVERLSDYAPDHLLGYYLAYRLEDEGSAAATEILQRFSAARDAELATGRPEYQAHGNSIETLTRAAAAGPAPVSNLPRVASASPEGADLFAANCAVCHGAGARGTQAGPPLIHKYYEPSHHDDNAIRRAVANGVEAHHWDFGNMPPVSGVSGDDVEKIISYIRGLQKANGIF